jgi:hypothetical protein
VDLERYRKDAKALVRAHRAGEEDALERAGAVLAGRAAQRFRLSDAQHVVAVEHGYATWPELKRAAETAPRERPVARIGLEPVSFYERRVEELRAADDDEAERRLALVPRRDPYVAVAREYGFETWRELVSTVERVLATHEGQREGSPEVLQALEALDRSDTEGLRALLDASPALAGHVHEGAWGTLLEALAQPDVVAGFPREAAELLIERSDDLDGALGLAACFDKLELVQLLLDAGADPAPPPERGLTPLETALYHGSRGSAEAIAERGISPLALWSAAGLGRLDLLRRLHGTPQASAHRPNLADVGWQPGPPPLADGQTVLDEALCFAAANGRNEAVQWLLERGAMVDGAPYLGVTPLHFAALFGRPTTVRLLLDAGADRTRRDRIHDGAPADWARHQGRNDLVALLEGHDSGLEYLPGEPVRLRVDVRRFFEVSDERRAVELAGRPPGWRDVARRIEVERVVNVSRHGAVQLPVMGRHSFEEIAERVANASLELYQALLDLAM